MPSFVRCEWLISMFCASQLFAFPFRTFFKQAILEKKIKAKKRNAISFIDCLARFSFYLWAKLSPISIIFSDRNWVWQKLILSRRDGRLDGKISSDHRVMIAAMHETRSAHISESLFFPLRPSPSSFLGFSRKMCRVPFRNVEGTKKCRRQVLLFSFQERRANQRREEGRKIGKWQKRKAWQKKIAET